MRHLHQVIDLHRGIASKSAMLMASGLALAVLCVASAPASACPNDVLRSELQSGQLPDCRAYELVTPPYKQGTFITHIFGTSQDGSRLLGSAVGAFAGTEDEPLGAGTSLLGAVYEFARTESGWAASSVAPPASRYTGNGMFDASADLGGLLWELETLSQPEAVTDFYLERPIGTFTEIGPPTSVPNVPNRSGYTYLGASADLSHMLFSTEPGLRWPFDTTAEDQRSSTLYEYVGTGNIAPSLVGVDNGGHLISSCGTRLGSSTPADRNGSMYNAISKTGGRVFFTAVGRDDHECGGEQPAVDELFAREELPSGETMTVAVSEPAMADCERCLTSGELRDAVFQGASEDGSKVFFTTDQELFPGATGGNLYEYDFNGPAGERVTRVSAGGASPQVQGVARISEDGSHVSFVAQGVLTATPNGMEQSAAEGADNLYVFERDARFPEGHISFVATLSPSDEENWARADNRLVLASRNGRFLVFGSRADLIREGVGGGKGQVFQYDAETGNLVRASIGQDGYNNNGRTPGHSAVVVNSPPGAYSYATSDSPTQANGVLAPEDGAVFFTSADALTPQALAGQIDAAGEPVPNVYEYRAGSVYLLSDGHDTSMTFDGPAVGLLGSSASGSDVFFTTADPLVGQDTDTEIDVYDVRAGGGFSMPLSLRGCSGDACQGTPSAPPTLPPPTTVTLAGEEGLQSPIAVHAKATPKRKTKPRKKTKRLGKKHGKRLRSARHHDTRHERRAR